MLATLLIVFREVLEAGLVISVILSACKGLNIKWQVISGIALGIFFACILAIFTNTIENALSGRGLEIFNATLLSLAAIMLVWQITWMSTHGKEIAEKNSRQTENILQQNGSRFAITIIVMVAVIREGSEVVLFLYSLMISSGLTVKNMLIGGLLGIALGALTSCIIYKGLISLPIKKIFLYSNILLSMIAAGLVFQATGILAGIDVLPALSYNTWDTSTLLSDNSWAGGVMRAIFGYTSTPLGIQLLSWTVTILIIVTLNLVFNRRKNAKSKTSY